MERNNANPKKTGWGHAIDVWKADGGIRSLYLVQSSRGGEECGLRTKLAWSLDYAIIC